MKRDFFQLKTLLAAAAAVVLLGIFAGGLDVHAAQLQVAGGSIITDYDRTGKTMQQQVAINNALVNAVNYQNVFAFAVSHNLPDVEQYKADAQNALQQYYQLAGILPAAKPAVKKAAAVPASSASQNAYKKGTDPADSYSYADDPEEVVIEEYAANDAGSDSDDSYAAEDTSASSGDGSEAAPHTPTIEELLAQMTPEEQKAFIEALIADSARTGDGTLNPTDGINYGPSGKETYYNLDMSYLVEYMHSLGYAGDYSEREDGAKMLGDKVMVAANLNIHPRGSIVETSLGTGIVADTGTFAMWHPYQLDVAVNW